MENSSQLPRFNYNDCNAAVADRFIGVLDADARFVRKRYYPTTEKSHFARYTYLYQNEKCVIVYDTVAKILSLTAKNDVLEVYKTAFDRALSGHIPLRAERQASGQNATVAKQTDTHSASAEKTVRLEKFARAKPVTQPTEAGLPAKAGENAPEYKDGFSVKKCSPDRLESILKRIRALNGVSVRAEPVGQAGTVQETRTYGISDKQKVKLKLRYMPAKQSLQLQGKRSNLFGEVQVIVSRDSGYLDAVNSHIELTGEGKRAVEISRQLKKLMPDAFLYLSDQSKTDLSIGMIDISNEEVRLSDYSVLLVPPYRGLERLIYDLQTAQGIRVKMIGQAYEKDDAGHYRLKLGYRKKLGSVIYNEVMSALYTEYFEQRNFYAHSDNSLQSCSRALPDKKQAKAIFDKLCAVINYNCKKLKEIGFSIQ